MIRAAHAGTCPRCDHPIRPGDPLTWRGWMWVCTRCASGGDD